MNAAVTAQQSREAFIDDLLAHNFTTYVAATHSKHGKGKEPFRFTSSPISPAVPFHWLYADAMGRLFDLGSRLTTEEAERRNINFVNPGLKEFMPAATLTTLRGGIQLLLPGEKALTHRHSANAFRFILEAPDEGAYTVVEGNRVNMHSGDLVLTPNWTWHDHHNEGNSHAIWYDGLDALMAFWIGAGFFQSYQEVVGEAYGPVRSTSDASGGSCGVGLIHRDGGPAAHLPRSTNPMFYYPYKVIRESLQRLASSGGGNPRDGILIDYVNPLNGHSALPSMGLGLRLVEANTHLTAMRRTENIVFIVKEGEVTFHLPEGKRLCAQLHDVVAIPSWVPYSIENAQDAPAILFSQSDRPLFLKLDLYRETIA